MKSKTFWIVLAAIIVLAGVSTGLIVYGVTTHSEPIQMRVCWINSTSDQYLHAVYEGMDCDKEDLIWPREQVPLKVNFATDQGAVSPDADDARVLTQTITDLNRELGFSLYSISEGEGVIQVSLVPIEARVPEGRTTHLRSGSRMISLISIQSGLNDPTLYRVLRHELLHAAGLAHDEYTLSVMYPLTQDDTGIEPQIQQIISDADRAFLRDQYMTR